MYQYYCLNPIAEIGLENFGSQYQKAEQLEQAQAVLVRSASMHEMELPGNLYAVARAGAGVNNIPLKECAERGDRRYAPRLQGYCGRNRMGKGGEG